jgi:hypothetical protein
MEQWNTGEKTRKRKPGRLSIIPPFHYSIIPSSSASGPVVRHFSLGLFTGKEGANDV